VPLRLLSSASYLLWCWGKTVSVRLTESPSVWHRAVAAIQRGDRWEDGELRVHVSANSEHVPRLTLSILSIFHPSASHPSERNGLRTA